MRASIQSGEARAIHRLRDFARCSTPLVHRIVFNSTPGTSPNTAMDVRSHKAIALANSACRYRCLESGTFRRSPALPLLLTLLTLTCGPPTPIPPPDDLLVIAAVPDRGALIPIARYAEGTWDRPPWARMVSIDHLTASSSGETGWRWPDGRGVWQHPARVWDTIAQPGHAVAVGVPDSWLLSPAREPDLPLTTLGLSIAKGSCYVGKGPSRELRRGVSWVVRTRDPERPFHRTSSPLSGVALSRTPTAVLAAADAPDPREIRAQLRREDPGRVSPFASFRWRGIYQFEDMRFGVLGHVGNTPGIMYAVVELHGDQPRVVLTAGVEPCSSEPTPTSEVVPPFAGDNPPPAPNALWIAVADRDEGILMPVARYQHGSWDNPPWTDLFAVERIAAIRSGNGVWSWPDASLLWEHPARESDTLGRAPEVIAVGVPASWFLHSPRERGLPLLTTGLRIVAAGCAERWGIRTNLDTLPAFGDDRRISGIAFTHPPSAVLSEDDIPALGRIKEDLGFVDRLRDGEGYRRFYWLGLFRFDDGPVGAATLGILRGVYYEGSGFIVIQIDGDRGRVIARASDGGC